MVMGPDLPLQLQQGHRADVSDFGFFGPILPDFAFTLMPLAGANLGAGPYNPSYVHR